MRASLLLSIAVLIVAGCSQSGSGIAGAVTGTPEQKAVRAYLRENTNSGKWEEVRWWPAIHVEAVRWKELTKTRITQGVIRVKFRTDGALHDMYFTVHEGKAKPITNGTEVSYRSRFPD